MRKTILFVIICVLSTIFPACQSSSNRDKVYIVKTQKSTDLVEVKESSLRSATVLFSLNRGDTVSGYIKERRMVKIDSKGRSGWIHEDNLKRVKTNYIPVRLEQFARDNEPHIRIFSHRLQEFGLSAHLLLKFIFYLNIALVLLGFLCKYHTSLKVVFSLLMVTLSIAIFIFVWGYFYEMIREYVFSSSNNGSGGIKTLFTAIKYLAGFVLTVVLYCLNIRIQTIIFNSTSANKCNYSYGILSYPIAGILMLVLALIFDNFFAWSVVVVAIFQIIQIGLIFYSAKSIVRGSIISILYLIISIPYGILIYIFTIPLIPIYIIIITLAPRKTLYEIRIKQNSGIISSKTYVVEVED